MKHYFKVFLYWAALAAFVVGGSLLSSGLWGGKAESLRADMPLVYKPGMTAAQFSEVNRLPREVGESVMGAREAMLPYLDPSSLPEDELRSMVQRELALHNEEVSKNWRKIAIKFGLWLLFLGVVFVLLRRGLVKGVLRNWLYFVGVAVFGVALGADPSPMGTVKDAIVLYGTSGAVFPPRLIALVVFLLLVVAANKFICSWGCQLGVLQDLLFRLGRASGLRQYKPAFAAVNAVRVLFFLAMTGAALLFGLDLVEPVDPFKIYNPLAAGSWGWGFITLLLGASLLVYRPWCHLLCPFGLVGWLAEKISIYRITVNYSACLACGACEKACPSTVMGAILRRDRSIPDCFSCGDCLAVCPAKAVSFSAGRRELPPPGKF